jgi:hypothetical protein
VEFKASRGAAKRSPSAENRSHGAPRNMRWHAELSDENQKQLARLQRDVHDRMESAIDEFEEKDEVQSWPFCSQPRTATSNVKYKGGQNG